MKFKDYINDDMKRCDFLESNHKWWRVKLLYEHEYIIWKYQLYLRKEEFYSKRHNWSKILSIYYRRKKNLLGSRLGFTIHKDSFQSGLRIWHYGSIVVNAHAKIGKNCTLHGENCIGNNGINNKCPIIGDNVDIGIGAKIIGGITIANNVIIAAGAIVNKSILEENVIVAGVPAKIIKKISYDE